MARFRATIQGARGPASRLGHQTISANVNAWDAGVRVAGYVNVDGEDCFAVYMTTGSNATGLEVLLGTVTQRDGQAIWLAM